MGWGYLRKRTGWLTGRNQPIVIGDNSYRIGDAVMQFDYGPTQTRSFETGTKSGRQAGLGTTSTTGRIRAFGGRRG